MVLYDTYTITNSEDTHTDFYEEYLSNFKLYGQKGFPVKVNKGKFYIVRWDTNTDSGVEEVPDEYIEKYKKEMILQELKK
jgi:hypothetical protein